MALAPAALLATEEGRMGEERREKERREEKRGGRGKESLGELFWVLDKLRSLAQQEFARGENAVLGGWGG